MFRNKSKKVRFRLTWRSWHKWVGVGFTLFIVVFCFSGIILNHRRAFSSCEVARWWLPSAYHIDNWNQGVIKGTVKMDGKLIAYGQTGVWLTDSEFKEWKDLNNGITEGVDNRKISNVVRTSDGTIWCAGLYDAYRFDRKSSQWTALSLPGNDERISDIALRGDTVVVLTRSSVFEGIAPEYSFVERPLHKPEGYDSKVTLFKTVWMLHSGEFFGLAGRLIVDAMGIVLIILCVTGLVFFLLTYSVKKKWIGSDIKRQAGWMKWNLRWHNRLGAGSIILTTILAVTGMCLRPPLMVPLAITKVAPMPGSILRNDNAFHDKMRAIRWDEVLQSWLISTSDGFYALSNLRDSVPIKIGNAPNVSPMGMNVFCRNPKAADEWIIGSFSGLFRWNPANGSISDYFTGKSVVAGHGRPVATHAVTGWSTDLDITDGTPVIFEYSAAPSISMPKMPEILRTQPMSLWNFALELHVGRCYEPFLGSAVSVMFVFISGLLLTLILISGYVLYRRSHKRN